MRVRIVEDNEDIAQLLSWALVDAGFDVNVTTTDFHDLLHPGPWAGVDAALVDLMLPHVDGTRVLQYLAEKHTDIRRLAITAAINRGEDVLGLADTLFIKPFSPRDIVEALR